MLLVEATAVQPGYMYCYSLIDTSGRLARCGVTVAGRLALASIRDPFRSWLLEEEPAVLTGGDGVYYCYPCGEQCGP